MHRQFFSDRCICIDCIGLDPALNDKVTDAQFVFKANYSTVDAIFILDHFIQEKIRTKGKLFCCFVDFRKAYDLINRNCLWYKLIKDGIDGKMFNMLRSMYKECVN